MLDDRILEQRDVNQQEQLIETPKSESTIALLHCMDLIDEFLDHIDISFETFCNEFIGSWMFGYINALKRANVRTVLFCISARVAAPSRFTHAPTGTRICVLPASKSYLAYRAVRSKALGIYGGSEGQSFKDIQDSNSSRHSLLAKLKDLAKSVGAYLSTPMGLLAHELRREGCDAILCQEYEYARFDTCVLLGQSMHLPVFATFQGGDKTQSWLEYPLRQLAFRACTGIIVSTQTEIQRVRTRYRLPSSKIARIFDPMDTVTWQAIDRSEARATLGIPLNASVVVCHGRIDFHRKGLDILLAAWDQICRDHPDQDLRLLLVGTGPDSDKLRQCIAKMQLQGVMWLDEFVHDRAVIRCHLSAADVYTLASRQEGFPIAPIEAMACSLPVVAADAPGVPDILEGGEASGGLVVPREDSRALALALGRVLDDQAWRLELGKRARRRVEEYFSPEAIGKQLRSFLLREEVQLSLGSASPDRPKVSVVIPAFNAVAYLPAAVESVLKQTFIDVEVLIVDDGSTDGIGQWTAQIADPRVQLVSQQNQGVSAARNTGITRARGEYVAFLDADDLWDPTKLEKQVRHLDGDPAVGLVYTWTALVDERGNPTGRVFTSQVEGNVWEQIVVDDMISNGSSPMVRRSCFETVGMFDTNLAIAEDYDMWTRIAARYQFAVVKEVLTFYRRHSDNTTNNRQKTIQGLRQVIEKIFQSAPLELLYLRNRSYANINLGLAWLSVNEGDYRQASHFRQQALLHHSQLRYSEKFIRLSLAIASIQWFGPQGYDGIRTMTRTLRQRLLGVTT